MTASEQIIQVIDALCAKLGIAIDWTSENVIPYIEVLCGKLVNYEIWTSVFSMVLWLSIMIASIVAAKKFSPIFKNGLDEDRRNYDIGWTFTTIIAVIFLIVIDITAICTIECQIKDIIKCLTFPEMYVFEYVQNIVNGG